MKMYGDYALMISITSSKLLFYYTKQYAIKP